MDRRVLLSAVGFRPEMILPLLDVLEPAHVHLLAGTHGEVVKSEKAVLADLKRRGIPWTIDHVPDWDIQGWQNIIVAALDKFQDDHVTINVSAGHGLAVALLSIQAAKRGLSIACYNWEPNKDKPMARGETRYLHEHSPAAILHLRELQPIDRAVLRTLARGKRTVSELVDETGEKQSTLSTCLNRLVERGFLDREAMGRNRTYSLRRGLKPLIEESFG